ncbi:hypothetical protein RCO31_01450 [Bradyrhizobium sp. LHD-71]|nr:hypothetical protein [Bradyrhizobium sp. LHD-71]MDQ8726364.1 hypothetical protein [Bradyrhizobium sp. LHD-71]
MTAVNRPTGSPAALVATIESSAIATITDAAQALAFVRDGVITGEGPTTTGRVHFSRSLDARDAEWCTRILTSDALNESAVSREEAQALFQIDEAAAERSDDGKFDDLFAKAILHHAASASGLPVPPRAVALSPTTAIESWAPSRSSDVKVEVLEWVAAQMRGRRRTSRTLMTVVAALLGAALPLSQSLPHVADLAI